VALFFSCSLSFGQVSKQGTKETYKDIINKAYNLSLQKDRSQAVSLLLGALKKEAKKSGAQKELVQVLDQVTKVFISDKAQQQYELGLSLKFTDPNMALSKLSEASRLEPENTSIEMAIAQQQMMLNDCDGAYSRVSKYKELANYLEDWRLLSAQTAICEANFEVYQSFKQVTDLKGPMGIYWLALEAEYFFSHKYCSKRQRFHNSSLKNRPSFSGSLLLGLEIVSTVEKQGRQTSSKVCHNVQVNEQPSTKSLCRRTFFVSTYGRS
jgi:hypothetical protein